MLPSRFAAALAALCCVASSFAVTAVSVPAFPGAEGAGAMTPGGRGGRVIKVTNLNDTGPGSFRAAVEAEGARIVVFEVGGLITLSSPVVIKHPFLTIAGQTAPGDGICIRGDTTTIDASDVIIRHLRFRRGNLKSRDDALNAIHSPGNLIIDHCSFSWGLDENVSIYRYMKREAGGKRSKNPIENITIQWCISSEALDLNHHAFGATWGGRRASFHHNLFANNTARNPSIGWGDQIDFRNNVIANWQHRTIDGGDATSLLNIVDNYYKAGPATGEGEIRHRIARPEIFRNFHECEGPGRWHVTGNVVEGHPEVSADNWAGGVQYEAAAGLEMAALLAAGRNAAPVPMPAVETQSASAAYQDVLSGAGATRPRRDAVDERVVNSVRTGKPTFKNGIIRTPKDVGGWPAYAGAPAPVDQDADGMPDMWEKEHGLDPKDAADAASDRDGNGYTAIEEYINQLAGERV
jgi:pectate lyase